MASRSSALAKGIVPALLRSARQSALAAAGEMPASAAAAAGAAAAEAVGRGLIRGVFGSCGRRAALGGALTRLFGMAAAGAGLRGTASAGVPRAVAREVGAYAQAIRLGSGGLRAPTSGTWRGGGGLGGAPGSSFQVLLAGRAGALRGLRSSSSGGGAGLRAAVAAGAGTRAAGRIIGYTRGPSLVRTVWQDSKGYTHFEGRGGGWSSSGGGGGGSDRRRHALYGCGALGVLFVSYYVYSIEEVPYTGRRHSIMMVSVAGEKSMGRQLFEEIKTMAAAEGKLLPPGHLDSLRVERIGRRIAAVAGDGGGGGSQSHMQGLQWEFAIIQNPQPNAFVVPGGKVVVYTGLLKLLGPHDDELAAVLAHEVGHVLARHSAERMSTLNAWALFNMLLRLTLGFGVPNVAMVLGIFLPYSRLAEHEADQLGLRLMSRACFDPTAAPVMLAKLNAAEKAMAQRGVTAASMPEFLRTHPLTEERVRGVEAELPEAFRLYSAAGCAAPRDAFGRSFGAWSDRVGDGWGTEAVRFG